MELEDNGIGDVMEDEDQRSWSFFSGGVIHISRAWERYSDLRFGQLISNIVTEEELFYVEDDLMLTQIQRWEQKNMNGGGSRRLCG